MQLIVAFVGGIVQMIHFKNPEKREKIYQPYQGSYQWVDGILLSWRTALFAARVGSSSLAQVNSYVGQGRWCKDEGDRCSNLIPKI